MGFGGGFGGGGGPGGGGRGGRFIENTVRSKSDTTLIKRLLKYFNQSKKYVVYTALSVAVFVVASTVGPVLTGDAIDWYIYPNSTLGTNVFGLGLIVIAYLGATVVTYLAESTQTYTMAIGGQKVVYTLRKDAVANLQKLSLNYYNDKPAGEIISHVTNDVDVLNNFLTFQSTQLISGFFSIVAIMAVMLYINWQLALYSLTIVPMLLLLILSLQSRMRTNWMNTRRSIGAVTAKVAESMAGMKVTQAFAAEGQDNAEFTAVNQRNMETNIKAARLSSLIGPCAKIIQSFGIFVVFYLGAIEVAQGTVEIGVLAAFYIWLNNLFRPIQQLTQFYPQYQQALTGFDRVLQIIDEPTDLREAPDASELKDFDPSVDFNHVSFRYKSGDLNALADADVHIAPKEVVAIVGHTGAGKTTFVNLLFRLYDPVEGSIMVGGHDLRSLTFKSLRSKMAIVLQDPFLFSATVRENIRYGRLTATDDEVIQAAKDVGLHEFILKLPQGYDTPIRESANNISVGQKQLLSMARAVLADPKILVLDEATSKVDPFTELLIQKALEKVFVGRTTFIIAHRLSTIRMANRILVFDHGKLIEQGSHAELLAKDGAYAKLYRIQFQETVTPKVVE